jgi:hypothetical protein
MYARSHSIESRRVQEFAEQQISNIIHAAYENNESTAFLDGCADQDKKGVMCLHKEHSDKFDSKESMLFAPNYGIPGDALNVKEDSNLEIFNSSMLPNQSTASDGIMPCFAERTEVPNTPTQRTSHFDLPSPSPKLKGGVNAETPGLDESSTPIEPRRLATTVFTAVLCSVCQKQRVFAKKEILATW